MAINGKTILGKPHATNKLITHSGTDLALTYYVVSNRSLKHATVHIIAGDGTNAGPYANRVIAIIPLPPKKSYYSVGQFRLIMDSDIPFLYVKEIENTSPSINDEIDVAISYFTK